MHEALESHPAIKEWQAQRADLQREEVESLARREQLWARHRDALSAWEEATAEARQRGEPDPPRPEEPRVDYLLEEHRTAVARLRAHQERLPKLLAQAAPDVLPVLRDGLARVVERVRPHVEALDQATSEARHLHVAYRQTLQAVETADPNRREVNGRSTRLPTSLNVADLLDAAHGRDLLEPAPLAGTSESMIQRADDAPESDDRHRVTAEEAALGEEAQRLIAEQRSRVLRAAGRP